MYDWDYKWIMKYKTHFVYKVLCYYMFPLQRTGTHLVKTYFRYVE
jgi:hypothetical protein